VVGFCYQNQESNAFLYRYYDDTIKDIGSLGGQATTATAINNAEQIVGYSTDSNNNVLAFLYTQNQGITSLGTLAGGSNSEAFAINGSGQIVGDSQADGDTHRPALFGGDGVQDLGVSAKNSDTLKTAYGINAGGQIVGESDSETQKRAFVYTNGKMFDLTQLAINLRKAGFSALDVADGINSEGWIVGFGTTLDGRINAFLAIPVGVTADPPGGPDAPVFDSGAIVAAWSGVGWFCPPNLWQPPWHHHPHPWPTPPGKPRPTPTPRWPTPPRPGSTPTPRPTPTPKPNPTPRPTPVPTPTPRPTPTPTPKQTPTPPQIQIAHRSKATPTPSHHNNEGHHNEGHNNEGHHKETGTTNIYDPHQGGGENSGRRLTHITNTEHHPTPLTPRGSPTPPRTLKRHG
jgi:probable HAF family extracellular repeat protein